LPTPPALHQAIAASFDNQGYGASDVLSNHRRLLVHAFQIIPANGKHFEPHLQPVTQRADLGTVIVGPLHWHLCGAHFELVGQEQQFRIKAPALDTLPGKDGSRGVPPKGLKSALGVAILQSERNAQRQIEKSSIKLPVPWLPLSLQFTLQPSRTDRNVSSFL